MSNDPRPDNVVEEVQALHKEIETLHRKVRMGIAPVSERAAAACDIITKQMRIDELLKQ